MDPATPIANRIDDATGRPVVERFSVADDIDARGQDLRVDVHTGRAVAPGGFPSVLTGTTRAAASGTRFPHLGRKQRIRCAAVNHQIELSRGAGESGNGGFNEGETH